jgi:hypothetical protein
MRRGTAGRHKKWSGIWWHLLAAKGVLAFNLGKKRRFKHY